MKVLMISWEYPPKTIGGLSNHVYYLSHSLCERGNEVHVITCEEGTAPIDENDKGVFVHRVTPYAIDTQDFTKWVMQLNFAMVERAVRLINESGEFDLIHVHDWLTAFCAKTLKWSFRIPLVCTIHATEYGRNGGINTVTQRYISATEWMLTYESWKVIACSNYMKNQINKIFSAPEEKIWVISNGVNVEKFEFEFDWLSFRRKYAMDNEKIIFCVGRHVFEKGIHLLIEAAPSIINRYNDSKFIIAGTGPMTEELKDKVRYSGLESKFLFTGYMDEMEKDKLYRVANAAVFPSLYEPFGIVALEAMAAGCPVVVSDTGGLSEIVEHGKNGLKCINGNANSIADNVVGLLYDEEFSKYISDNGKDTVKDEFTWNKIADLTLRMYHQVLEEAGGTEWRKLSSENNHSAFREDYMVYKSLNEENEALKKIAKPDDNEDLKDNFNEGEILEYYEDLKVSRKQDKKENQDMKIKVGAGAKSKGGTTTRKRSSTKNKEKSKV
ncbi:glycosyltransferase family 4 protein [Clostridium sp. WILCCON 0269]|uniref:Glycosyltransferase family 4 protein n=1 Tax=Candidatus Clostridium eludens TaxID=3381663 RepID=A0ABW8SHI4_9CLOT